MGLGLRVVILDVTLHVFGGGGGGDLLVNQAAAARQVRETRHRMMMLGIVTFVERAFCVRHDAKFFTCTDSFNLSSNL